jgi:hypothetical protein
MRNLGILILLGIIFYFLYWLYFPPIQKDNTYYIAKLKANYEYEIEAICKEMNLPAEYFKALVILESSAEKPASTRFEPHVFKRLKEVQDAKAERYGRFTTKQLQILSEETLKKMATSWGPMQIMGYHCIPMGITLEQLNGPQALRYAIQWAEKSYGGYLRRGDFANALHLHNTGQPIPSGGRYLTHNPDYIDRGMELIAIFRHESNRQ